MAGAGETGPPARTAGCSKKLAFCARGEHIGSAGNRETWRKGEICRFFLFFGRIRTQSTEKSECGGKQPIQAQTTEQGEGRLARERASEKKKDWLKLTTKKKPITYYIKSIFSR